MTTPDADLPPLFPLDEVIDKYRLNKHGVYIAAYRKQFEHIRIGRTRYLTLEQLNKFLAERTVATVDRNADDLATVRARRTRQRATRKPR